MTDFYYKVFTSDLCPPIQGGEPIWGGTLPFDLPTVELDESDKECGKGWNACRDPQTALKIAGFWPNGKPSRIFRLVPSATDGKVIERKDKVRAATWTIQAELTDQEVNQAIFEFSGVFGEFQQAMTDEQIAWRKALSRPNRDVELIKIAIQKAFDARGLTDWTIKQFETEKTA